ncbi:hypothetical protein BH11MYX2_BH11MYX2_20710 [soil metagenome]
MSFVQVVTDVARDLKLLDPAGKLVVLDSLTIVDMIADLEVKTNVMIPSSDIRNEVFSSIESIVKMLERLSAEASPT